MKSPMFTTADVMARLNIGYAALARLLKSGKLRGLRLGDGPKAEWRIDERDLDAFIEAQKAKAHGSTISASVDAAFDADDALGLTERRF